MHNCTEQRCLERTYSAVSEENLFSRNFKRGMFGLGIAPKENFLAHSTQFLILTSSITGSGYMELRENMCILTFPFFLL